MGDKYPRQDLLRMQEDQLQGEKEGGEGGKCMTTKTDRAQYLVGVDVGVSFDSRRGI